VEIPSGLLFGLSASAAAAAFSAAAFSAATYVFRTTANKGILSFVDWEGKGGEKEEEEAGSDSRHSKSPHNHQTPFF